MSVDLEVRNVVDGKWGCYLKAPPKRGARKSFLKSLYKFWSDYPGIRHGGNPASVKRVLATRDLTMASLLILSFSGYLSPHFDERTMLGVVRKNLGRTEMAAGNVRNVQS